MMTGALIQVLSALQKATIGFGIGFTEPEFESVLVSTKSNQCLFDGEGKRSGLPNYSSSQ